MLNSVGFFDSLIVLVYWLLGLIVGDGFCLLADLLICCLGWI